MLYVRIEAGVHQAIGWTVANSSLYRARLGGARLACGAARYAEGPGAAFCCCCTMRGSTDIGTLPPGVDPSMLLESIDALRPQSDWPEIVHALSLAIKVRGRFARASVGRRGPIELQILC